MYIWMEVLLCGVEAAVRDPHVEAAENRASGLLRQEVRCKQLLQWTVPQKEGGKDYQGRGLGGGGSYLEIVSQV